MATPKNNFGNVSQTTQPSAPPHSAAFQATFAASAASAASIWAFGRRRSAARLARSIKALLKPLWTQNNILCSQMHTKPSTNLFSAQKQAFGFGSAVFAPRILPASLCLGATVSRRAYFRTTFRTHISSRTVSVAAGDRKCVPKTATSALAVCAGLGQQRAVHAGNQDMHDQFKQSIFDVFEKKTTPPLRKSFLLRTGVTAKPKNSDAVITATNAVPLMDSSTGVPYASVQVGEDAYFCRHDSIGVADGVGSWTFTEGTNAALYSLKLMHYAHNELEKYDDISNLDYTVDDYYSMSPQTILSKSYDLVTRDAARDNIIGSTTAIVAVLRDDELRIANIGDCGIMVLRNITEPIFRSEEQQHSFNFPYQLGSKHRDTPDQAQVYTIKIQEGDIIVVASDGLFDNVFDDDIVDIVAKHVGPSLSSSSSSSNLNVLADMVDPQRISDALLRRTREISEELRYTSSPFQSRAIQEGFYYQGGKADDVTIVVGVVKVSEDSPDRR